MKHQATSTDAIEHDPVWQLVEQSPMPIASGAFSDRVVRAAREGSSAAPSAAWRQSRWWVAPIGAAAALALAVWLGSGGSGLQPAGEQHASPRFVQSDPSMAELQAIAETEALVIASDHMDDFSDYELVSLMGF